MRAARARPPVGESLFLPSLHRSKRRFPPHFPTICNDTVATVLSISLKAESYQLQPSPSPPSLPQMTNEPLQRSFCAHQPQWQRFQALPSDTEPYQRQYSHVYHHRLRALGPRCLDAIPEDNQVPRVQRILELADNEKAQIAVGTIVHQNDEFFLEDESGRVSLDFHADIDPLCTGMVLACQGIVSADGTMAVHAVYAPHTTPAPPLPANNRTQPAYLLLISGIQLGDPTTHDIPRDLLITYLQGRLGHKAHQVARVIIAGGLVQRDPTALVDLDIFLLQITSSGIPVDVLPGKDDPTTANWPQRPLHPALLRQTHSRMSKLLRVTPNPYACQHDHARVLGTDGTNVRDICDTLQCTPVEALEKIVTWSHLCPTGPDSIPTVPHIDMDPMVMDEEAPHLLFSGNADAFDTKVVHNTRLVCVPSFARTGEAVLVNVDSMQVEVLRFQE